MLMNVLCWSSLHLLIDPRALKANRPKPIIVNPQTTEPKKILNPKLINPEPTLDPPTTAIMPQILIPTIKDHEDSSKGYLGGAGQPGRQSPRL